MGVLDQVFQIQNRELNPVQSLAGWITGAGGSPKATKANANSAFRLSAYYNAIDILSDDIAKLPKHVFLTNGKEKNKLQTHWLNYLMNIRPNAKMTASVFWKTVEVLRLNKGNCFVQQIRDPKSGYVVEWQIRENHEVTVLEDDHQLFYKYKGKVYHSDDFMHFIGFSLDGKIGVGVVTYAAVQMGVALEAQNYGQTIYQNRGLTYGVIESDASVTEPNKKLISKGFTKKLSNGDPHKAPILDEGLKYKKITITPAETQFLETNKNAVIEVCRWLNIAPHKVKSLADATFSNIYQQSIEHVQDSVLPRVIAKEQEVAYKNFSREDLSVHYIKFNVASLLRGDLDAKSKFYTAMVYAGVYTRNEVRALEDMNPIKGLDEPLQPVNMQTLENALKLIENKNSDGKKTD